MIGLEWTQALGRQMACLCHASTGLAGVAAGAAGDPARWPPHPHPTLAQVMLRVRQVLQGSEHAGGMPPFPSTVVRCCSDAHAERGAEVLAAAAAAREAEATGDGLCGEEGSGLDEDAIDAALAEAPSGSGSLGSGGSQPPSAAASGLDSSASGSSAGSGGGDAAAAAPASKQQQQPFRILVTGHSLGGSVATLCAYDLAHALPGWGSAVAAAPVAAGEGAGTAAAAAGAAATPAGAAGSAAEQAEGRQRPQQRPVLLSCYTFGAPRTGDRHLTCACCALAPCLCQPAAHVCGNLPRCPACPPCPPLPTTT